MKSLRKIPMFESLTDEALEQLGHYTTMSRYQGGDVIFREGDPGDSLCLIESGEIEIRKKGKTLAMFKSGQIFGEMALFESEKRSADAVASCETTLYSIRNEDFRKFLLERPEEGVRFLYNSSREISRRLRRTSEYLTMVFETGKIVAQDLGVAEMSQKILERLLEDIQETTGGMILILNPFTEEYDIASQLHVATLDLEGARAFMARNSADKDCQDLESGVVLRVALKDGERVLGQIFLEKHAEHTPFTTEQEVIVSAVGNQVGLGLLNAYRRQEDEARERLARSRMRGY
ncbi:MAG: cyclic nucleotide-binding domain-containing protein [Planctomycetota bacterium]